MKLTPKQQFEMLLRQKCSKNKIMLLPEYHFYEGRQWRADFYIETKTGKWLFEYEGGLYTKVRVKTKSGEEYWRNDGHQTPKGYADNCEKYRMAAWLGYKVARFTVRDFDTEHTKETLEFIDMIFGG